MMIGTVVVVVGGGKKRVADKDTQPLPLTVMPSPSTIVSGPGTSNNAQPLTVTSWSYTPASSPRPDNTGLEAEPEDPVSSNGVTATTGPSAWPAAGGVTAPIVTASNAEATASRGIRGRWRVMRRWVGTTGRRSWLAP